MLLVTSLATLLNLLTIHLFTVFMFSGSLFWTFFSFMFIWINLAAFQILFAKFLLEDTFSSENLISFPGLLPIAKVNLKASAPYLSIISRGSIPFPRDLDIFLPWASLTRPCINTFLNGTSPINSLDANIILATQKKIISYPVTSVSVGKK